MKKLFMLLASVLIMLSAGCSSGGDSDPIPEPASSAKAITAFSLNGVVGTINEAAKTIGVTMPYGTSVTNLVATFPTTGTSVKVGSTVQVSGTTVNDFTNPVVYTVSAIDGSTQDYTVVVTVALSSSKAITAFSLNGVVGTINEASKTIGVTMPNGTDVRSLVATFTTTGTSVKVGSTVQVSGTTVNDFTNPVVYTVTAADNSTQDYTVVVAVALSSAKAITAFSLNGVVGTINEASKTIGVTMPYGTYIQDLVAIFTTTGVSVKVGTAVQVSGTTAHNFTNPVVYRVSAADNSTQDYTVVVAVALSPAKAITAFSLNGVVGTINEAAKTIGVTMPNGTDVRSLVATFTTTGTSVKVGSIVQVSGTTVNDFTNQVFYTVTAADNSTQDYTVVVAVADLPAAAITAFSLNGVNATYIIPSWIAFWEFPYGVDVRSLVATFTTTGTSVKVGSIVQVSGVTVNDFTNQVVYTVTAADGSSQDYTVYVEPAKSPSKTITAFSLNGVVGTINEASKTIGVTMPYGTSVTNLVATFTATGPRVTVNRTVQVSGTTAHNFTNPVVYTVTAADYSTQDYTVVVTVALSSAKAITAFSLDGVTGTINEASKTIALNIPYGRNLTSLVATFTTTGSSVKVGSTVQVSGTTVNDFTNPVVYRVSAADNSTQDYTVVVTNVAGWTRKADVDVDGRLSAVGFSIGNKGYIGTGYHNSTHDNDFWEYDPAVNIWTQKADYPTPVDVPDGLHDAVGFSIASKGYIGTGFRGSPSDDLYEYDPALNTWTRKAELGGGKRTGAVGFSIGNKGYIGTGFAYYKDFWEYDPALNTWTQKADFGGGERDQAVGFSIGNKGYIGTGLYGPSHYKDFWEYNPALNTWTQKADFGGGERCSAVGFSIGNKGYIGTGKYIYTSTSSTHYKDFWEYDPALNTWTQKSDFGGGERWDAVGFSIGDKGYIGTGGSSVEKDFWEYNPGP